MVVVVVWSIKPWPEQLPDDLFSKSGNIMDGGSELCCCAHHSL